MLIFAVARVIVAPLAALGIRFAVSRQREYLADATAADLLRDPQSVVDALRRIGASSTTIAQPSTATAHGWFEEPNDVSSRSMQAAVARKFATHPTIEQRVERLAQLNAGTVDLRRPLRSPREVSSPPVPPRTPPPPMAPPPMGPPFGFPHGR